MANIKLTLPAEPFSKQIVTFTAPCNCDEVTDGLIINGETYTVCDAMGECVTGKGGAWCAGAQISVVLDCENKKAFIQNAAVPEMTIENVTGLQDALNNVYTKEEVLSSATKQELGLSGTAIPDDAFSKIACGNPFNLVVEKISTSKVWTAPKAFKQKFFVIGCGGGGGGGTGKGATATGTNVYGGGGGGGGGGYVAFSELTLPEGTAITVTCGAGGAAGKDGGASSFGSYLTANGGKAGGTSGQAVVGTNLYFTGGHGGDGGAGGGGGFGDGNVYDTYGNGGNGSDYGGGGAGKTPGNGGAYSGKGGTYPSSSASPTSGADGAMPDALSVMFSLFLGFKHHSRGGLGTADGGEGAGGGGGFGSTGGNSGCGGGGGFGGNGGNGGNGYSGSGGGGGGLFADGGSCSTFTGAGGCARGGGGGGGIFPGKVGGYATNKTTDAAGGAGGSGGFYICYCKED